LEIQSDEEEMLPDDCEILLFDYEMLFYKKDKPHEAMDKIPDENVMETQINEEMKVLHSEMLQVSDAVEAQTIISFFSFCNKKTTAGGISPQVWKALSFGEHLGGAYVSNFTVIHHCLYIIHSFLHLIHSDLYIIDCNQRIAGSCH
jgi:hypothetical protein